MKRVKSLKMPMSEEYKSPTSIVWLLGRIYCTGTTQDYAAVHKMQDAISVVPLSSYGKPFTPPPSIIDGSWKIPGVKQVK